MPLVAKGFPDCQALGDGGPALEERHRNLERRNKSEDSQNEAPAFGMQNLRQKGTPGE